MLCFLVFYRLGKIGILNIMANCKTIPNCYNAQELLPPDVPGSGMNWVNQHWCNLQHFFLHEQISDQNKGFQQRRRKNGGKNVLQFVFVHGPIFPGTNWQDYFQQHLVDT